MFVVQTSDNVIFALIILQVFHRIILQDKLHTFNIQDNRSTLFPSTTNYKNANNIKRFYVENSPLDRTVQSLHSAVVQYAGQ